MSTIESSIAGSEKLTGIYGGWPTFHDAEVVELHHWRGQMKPGAWDDSNVMPVLTAKIHVFIEDPTSQRTLATLRFDGVEDYKMEGFNYQNALQALVITAQDRGKDQSGESLPPWLLVEFKAAFGMSASFHCSAIEVVDAFPCNEQGETYV